MQVAPLPPDERSRVASLHGHAILDTDPEADFDELTRLASALCATPIALVSLIDEQRQWFKSRVGLAVVETPRDLAFCAHAILQPEILEVPDTEQDPRFFDNPLVTGDPHIRFYAGAPLVAADGHRLGTLCVIDRVPRRLSAAQRDSLRRLADQAARHLEARRRLRELGQPGPPAHDPTAATMHGEIVPYVPVAHEPRRCGRFTVLRRIGEGAMATVYAAHDAELDRAIAIKLLHGDGDADTRVRVQREAQALARVSHPNVVQIFEIGSYGAQVFVAMELIDGLTLSDWRVARPRPLAEVLAMYVQAGRGLVAAHGAGIIHRDFKAANVIVGRDDRPRVVDFGLARILGGPPTPIGPAANSGAAIELTRAGTIVGTPAYMSPEQHRTAAVDERSDQFNFCAALYEAIYGRRPFGGSTMTELAIEVHAGVTDEPPPDPAVPEVLHRALLRGLAPDPARRWPSLAALLDNLEGVERRALAHDPVRARERRVLVGLLVALVLTVAGVVVYRLAAGRIADASAGLVLMADGALAIGLSAAWYVRSSLLVDALHRRMIAVALFLLAAGCVGRVLGMFAGLTVADMLLTELLMTFVGFAALACFVASSWWPLAALYLAGAIAIVVAELPTGHVVAVVFTAGALLYAREWRRVVLASDPSAAP